MADRDSLGERLLLSRRRAHLTQVGLSAQAGVGVSTITRLEQGRTRQVSSGVLERLAEALEVTTDYLLGRSAQRRPDAAEEDERDDQLVALHA